MSIFRIASPPSSSSAAPKDTTTTTTTTVTVTKPLPTFVARVANSGNATLDGAYLQSGSFVDADTNVLTLVRTRALATALGLTCESYLPQTSSTGATAAKQKNLIAAGLFTTGQAPVYFDPQAAVDAQTSGSYALYCRLNAATKGLSCYSLIPEKNRFQYCYLYEEFFSTGVLLGQVQGPECQLFDVKVELL